MSVLISTLGLALLVVGMHSRRRRKMRRRTISAWLDGSRPCAVRRG